MTLQSKRKRKRKNRARRRTRKSQTITARPENATPCQPGLGKLYWQYITETVNLLGLNYQASNFTPVSVHNNCFIENGFTPTSHPHCHISGNVVQVACWNQQVSRLLKAGYPSNLMVSVAEGLLGHVNASHSVSNTEACPTFEKKNVAFIPYIYRVSHSLKKLAARGNVQVVFSAPSKLQQFM